MNFVDWIGIALLLLAAAAVGLMVLARRFSDGPIGPIPGGVLRFGNLIADADVDWSFAAETQLVQLQLVEPLGSRTTGVIVYEGQLYVPCDLGFIWRRAPAPAKWLMASVSLVKRWHEQVLRDGRVVIRIRGDRYERQAVRVNEPRLLEALRASVEERAVVLLSSPLSEASPDTDAIWFFRLDPRSST